MTEIHELVDQVDVTVMCGHGARAMTAASLLASRPNTAVSVFDGGLDTWAATTGRALESGS